MSNVHNSIFVPTQGKDEAKFKRIPDFEKVSNTLFKEVISGFRMAGKVKDFILQHRLAVHYYGSDYNGYGYSTENYEYLMRPKDAKVVKEMLAERTVAAEKRKTRPEVNPRAAWCRRLAKLTGISQEDAERIADEKIEAQYNQIAKLEKRQSTLGYSVKREKLIHRIGWSNPLRRIKDEDHAFAILHASVRHNSSDYDRELENAREMAACGELDWSEVKDYAREHARYWSDVQSSFFTKEEENNESDDEVSLKG